MGSELLRRTAHPDGSTDGDDSDQAPTSSPPAPFPVATMTVGNAADPEEAAADRLVDTALRRLSGANVDMTGGGTAGSGDGHAVHRSVDLAGGGAIGREGGTLDGATSATIDRMRGTGAPLPEKVQRRMEGAFGQSFSGVRVHANADAAGLNRSVSARAFTTGKDIFFGEGQYRPGTTEGDKVLAHELGHVARGDDGRRLLRDFDEEDDDSGNVLVEDDPKPKGDGKKGKNAKKGKKSAKVDVVDPKSRKAKGNGLSRVASDALAAAKKVDPNYEGYFKWVDAWVTKDQQKQIADIAGVTQRSKGDVHKRGLKDLVRASLLADYGFVIKDRALDDDELTHDNELRAPTKEEQKKIDKRYFPRTLRHRDQLAGLIDKGPTSPEAQQWLKDNKFGAAVTIDEDTKAKDGGGPRIEMRSTFIGSDVLGAPRRMHLFIIYTTSTGEQYYFRGGPGEKENGVEYTECDYGLYDSSTVDWDPSAPTVTLLKGEKAQRGYDKLLEGSRLINGLKVPYVGAKAKANSGGLGGLEAFVSGENCNSVAWTLLERAGIPKKKPSGLHPGWGHRLGELLKQGASKLPQSESTSGRKTTIVGDDFHLYEIFFDRTRKELQAEMPGGTEVEYAALSTVDKMVKIRYNKDTIGWIRAAEVNLPKVPKNHPMAKNDQKLSTVKISEPVIDEEPQIQGGKVTYYLAGRPGGTEWVTAGQNLVQIDVGSEIVILDDDFIPGSDGLVLAKVVEHKTGKIITAMVDGQLISDKKGAVVEKNEDEDDLMNLGMQVGDDSSQEDDENVVKGPGAGEKFGLKGFLKALNQDGTMHEVRGMQSTKMVLIATGRTTTVKGRTLVEFTCEGYTIWAGAREFEVATGSKYPGT